MEIRNFLGEKGVFLIALFSFLVRLYRLNGPSNLVFDEEIYVGGFELSTSHHPPLGYFLFGLSARILGNNPLSWRLPSVLAGTLLILLVYFLALRLFRNKLVALSASLLLAFETLTFIHSRLATVDILLTFFILGAYCFFLCSLTTNQSTAGRLLFTALFLGFALSTKWSAIFSWVAILFLAAAADRRLILPLFFLPIAVYLAIFAFSGFGFSEIFQWHQKTFLFHSQTQEGFNLELSSRFWSWPLFFSPVSYFRTETFTPDGHWTQVINVFGNMPLFWAFLPAFAFLGWEAFRSWKQEKRRLSIGHSALIVFFFSHWLPWAFSPRPTFLYYFLPAVPVGCIAVAYCLERAWRESSLRRLVIGYWSLVVGFFILLYPILAALPIPEKVFDFISRLG